MLCRQMPMETIREREQLGVQLVGQAHGLRRSHGAARDFDAALCQVAGVPLMAAQATPNGQIQAKQSRRRLMPLRVLIQKRRSRRRKRNNQKPQDQGQEGKVLRVRAVVLLRHRPIPQTSAMRKVTMATAATVIPSLLHATVW